MSSGSYRKVCLEVKGRECKICGSDDDVVAHHLDGDRSNDDIDNLIPTCRTCHSKIHSGSKGYEKYYNQLDDSARVVKKKSKPRLKTPLKEHWEEYPTYLYPALYERVQEAYTDVEYQCKKDSGFNPQKYRHFQAVAWDIALEQLEDMDPSELVDRVDDLGLR